MQFPNEVQAALLLDTSHADLEQVIATFLSVMAQKEGTEFRVLNPIRGCLSACSGLMI